MWVGMCAGMCVDMCVDMCADMRVEICRHSCQALDSLRAGRTASDVASELVLLPGSDSDVRVPIADLLAMRQFTDECRESPLPLLVGGAERDLSVESAEEYVGCITNLWIDYGVRRQATSLVSES